MNTEPKIDVRDVALYEITGTMAHTSQLLEEILNNTEISEEEKAADIDRLMAQWQASNEALPLKLENVAKYRRSREAMAETYKREIDRLKELMDIETRAVEVLDEYTIKCLEALPEGQRKVETPIGPVSLSITAKGTLDILKESDLPTAPEYWRTPPPELKLAEFKKAVKAGEFEALLESGAIRWMPSKRLRVP